MDFRMSENDRSMMEMYHEFGARVMAPWVARCESGEFPREPLNELSKAGFMGMIAPEEYGGAGDTFLHLAMAIEVLGGYNVAATEFLNGSNCNVILPLLNYGTEEQKAKWIPPVATGEILTAFVVSEPDAGSDTTAMKTTAVLDGDEYIINGSKCWITNGNVADVYLLFAVTSPPEAEKKEISAFLLDRRTDSGKGVSTGKIEEKMGLHGTPVVSVYFDDVRVPAENLLGKLGDGVRIMMCGINPGRACLAGLATGVAQRAIDLTVQYVKERKLYGKRLADFQNTQFVLADCQTKVDCCKLLYRRAASLLDQEDVRKAKVECSMAKYYCAQVCQEVLGACIQLFGGYGYIHDYRIENLYRDCRVFTIFEGANEVHRTLIARHMGLME